MPLVDWRGLGRGLVRGVEHALPLNMGMFVGTVAGDRAPITNKDLGNADMVALRRAAADAMSLGVKRGKDTLMGYPNYPTSHESVDNPGWLRALKLSFTDPGYRTETTIGMARLHPDAQGNMHVVDTYDFNRDGPGAGVVAAPARLKYALKSPTKVLDALGYLAAPETDSNRRKVDINLGLVRPAYLGQTYKGAPTR